MRKIFYEDTCGISKEPKIEGHKDVSRSCILQSNGDVSFSEYQKICNNDDATCV